MKRSRGDNFRSDARGCEKAVGSIHRAGGREVKRERERGEQVGESGLVSLPGVVRPHLAPGATSSLPLAASVAP